MKTSFTAAWTHCADWLVDRMATLCSRYLPQAAAPAALGHVTCLDDWEF